MIMNYWVGGREKAKENTQHALDRTGRTLTSIVGVRRHQVSMVDWFRIPPFHPGYSWPQSSEFSNIYQSNIDRQLKNNYTWGHNTFINKNTYIIYNT